MFQFLQVFTLLLIAVTLAFSLAHAGELPGKLRLHKDDYLAVQTIYYPGFTIGGVSEPISVLALIAFVASIGFENPAFGWALAALVSMALVNAIFWLVTQPVNKIWLQNQNLSGASQAFFSAGTKRKASTPADWTTLRDKWEYSHVARAIFAMLGLIFFGVAITSPSV